MNPPRRFLIKLKIARLFYIIPFFAANILIPRVKRANEFFGIAR